MREKARAAALSFWRYFHEVRSKNFKTFLLGARRAGVCVLALVVLLSGVSIPAYADFGGTDSTNLANLTTYTRSIWDYIRVTLQSHLSNIYSRLGTMVTYLQSIANDASASASRLLDISNRITTLTNGVFSRLDSILSLLGGRSNYTYPLLDTPFTSMDSVFHTVCVKVLNSENVYASKVNGVWSFSQSVNVFESLHFDYNWSDPSVTLPYLLNDTVYIFSVSWSGGLYNFIPPDGYIDDSFSSTLIGGRTTVSYAMMFDEIVSYPWLTLPVRGSIIPGEVSFSVVRAPDSFVVGSAGNAGQADANQQLQDSVGQLEDFDNKIFTDVSDYTSQLDFGLGDWSEAAAGISYIGSIFMLVWDNSPTQVIVLSLMVGLCLLILGRGPRVAGEVRRHEERASRRKKGG